VLRISPVGRVLETASDYVSERRTVLGALNNATGMNSQLLQRKWSSDRLSICWLHLHKMTKTNSA